MQDVLSFLKELEGNNHKDWMDANKSRYKGAREMFISLIAEVIEGITQFDPTISGIEAKKTIFRLNRDVRFSKDKSPYKTNFGASISSGGKNSPFAGYYVHLKPGNNFVGGGMYMPDAPNLKKIRQEIDYNTEQYLDIIKNPDLAKVYGELQGDALKTAPKGYPKDHPHIELLRKKSFYFMCELSDKEITTADLRDNIVNRLKLVHPFIQFLNTALD